MKESSRTVSNKDREIAEKMMKELLGESSRTISTSDRAQVDEVLEKMMKRNDGGMAEKTRVF